jgi:hypothetical protein
MCCRNKVISSTQMCRDRPLLAPATSSPPSPAPTSPPGAAPTQALPPRGRGPRWRALDQFNSIDAAGEGSGLKILATGKAYSGRSLRASKGTVRNAQAVANVTDVFLAPCLGDWVFARGA